MLRTQGKDEAQLAVARQTYLERVQHCNVGWCQDLLQAASLGLTKEATALPNLPNIKEYCSTVD